MRLVSSTELTDHAAVVALSGELDLATEQELRGVLLGALAERTTLVVDMTALRMMDSTSLNVLVHVHKRAKQLSGVVALAAVPPMVARSLAITGLNRVFPTYPTATAALAELPGRSSQRQNPSEPPTESTPDR